MPPIFGEPKSISAIPELGGADRWDLCAEVSAGLVNGVARVWYLRFWLLREPWCLLSLLLPVVSARRRLSTPRPPRAR